MEIPYQVLCSETVLLGVPAANNSEDVAMFQDSSDHQLQRNFRKMSGLKGPGQDSTCAKAT